MNISDSEISAHLRIQSTILEMIVLQSDLDDVLGRLCLLVQELIPSSVASLMLIDKASGRLNMRSAPSIPEETRKCFDGLAMSPTSGSCGTAAYTGEMVIVENTMTDPRWENMRDLARRIRKLACWSVPVFYAEEIVGTFAISRSVAGTPSESELQLLRTAGNLVGIAITNDRTVAELRDQKSLLQNIIDSAEDPIYAKDPDGRYLLVNRAKAEASRRAPAEMIGRRDVDLQPGPLADENALTDRQVLSSGEGQLFEQAYEDPERGPRTYLIRKNPLVDANGDVTGVLEIARDVSALKTAEEALRRAQQLECLGVLAGGIAHDFNNLLTGILGNAQLLLDRATEQDEPLRTGLSRIGQAANRAAELTKQMLAYSGRAELSRKVISLPDLVEDVATLLASSISKKAQLTFEIEPDLPNIEGDATQMRQLVMNIITNASEALDGRSGEIAVDMRSISRSEFPTGSRFLGDAPQGDRFVVLRVRDTGHGMDSDTISRIFDPFFSTKFVGRGLGLAAVQGIVRGLSGAIGVESEVGIGTTFSVYLPVCEKPLDTSAETDPFRWTGTATVLVVDDEEVVSELATIVLQEANLRVLNAKDGQEAVDIYRTRSREIDVVVLDLTTPRLTGREVCDELRAIRDDVRIVLSSGYVEEDATRDFDERDLVGFVQKPYTPSDLLRAVRDSLS